MQDIFLIEKYNKGFAIFFATKLIFLDSSNIGFLFQRKALQNPRSGIFLVEISYVIFKKDQKLYLNPKK